MEQNKALDILMTAKKLLSDPRRWIKGSYQKQRDGEMCYCSMGAIYAAASGSDTYSPVQDRVACRKAIGALQAITNQRAGLSVISYNDSEDTTHGDVLEAFTDAINAELAASGTERGNIPVAA